MPDNFYEIFPVQPNEITIPIIGKLDFDDIVDSLEIMEASVGGDLSEDDTIGLISYTTADNSMTITFDTDEKIMIIKPNVRVNCLTLIDLATKGWKKLTGNNNLLLPG